MIFSCERPAAVYGLLPLIPAIYLSIKQYRQIKKHLGASVRADNSRFFRTIVMRTVFRGTAWLMLVLAYAGFSWGTYNAPIQTNGNAVALVFDISYSMNATDAPGGMTRLQAAGRYADMLISHTRNTSFSAVLAKGSGMLVVPFTEDTAIIQSLLDTLSPALMTAQGTSLGKGINAAVQSFPALSSQAKSIWVFTDGDETDGQLEGALADCVKYGVPVTLIGFGSERETAVTAGDGKTTVLTALRSKKMQKATAAAEKRNSSIKSAATVRYIDATEPGSALKILRTLNSKDMHSVSYEIKPVERYRLFLSLALIFFCIGFIVTEFDKKNFSRKNKTTVTAAIVLGVMPFIFTSCSLNSDGAKNILQSTWLWHQKKYQKAVSLFLTTEKDAEHTGDKQLAQYALYGLSTTYLMENEDDAAMKRIVEIAPDAPSAVRYAANYNAGIIAHRNGNYESAVAYFRQALKADGSKIDAKVNLELAMQQKIIKETHGKEAELTPVAENKNDNSAAERAVFERIRENDRKQWKNSESSANSNSSVDY